MLDIAHPTAEGKPYLGVVEDACSNRTVGYSIDSPMASPLAVKALRNALAPRAAVDTIVHSERGSSPGHPAVAQASGRDACRSLASMRTSQADVRSSACPTMTRSRRTSASPSQERQTCSSTLAEVGVGLVPPAHELTDLGRNRVHGAAMGVDQSDVSVRSERCGRAVGTRCESPLSGDGTDRGRQQRSRSALLSPRRHHSGLSVLRPHLPDVGRRRLDDHRCSHTSLLMEPRASSPPGPPSPRASRTRHGRTISSRSRRTDARRQCRPTRSRRPVSPHTGRAPVVGTR